MEQIVAWMDEVIANAEDEAVIEKVGDAVKACMSRFPLFSETVAA